MSANPEYHETFIYPLSDDDLEDATMMFQVYAVGKRRKKRDLLGWFAFGLNNSGPCESAHWQEMCENKDCDVCHWQELKSVWESEIDGECEERDWAWRAEGS